MAIKKTTSKKKTTKKTRAVTVSGLVEKLGKKIIGTVNGKKPIYSFLLDDGEWYRTGFKNPEVEEGDFVEFKYTEDDYGKQVDMKSLDITEGEETEEDVEDDDDEEEEDTTTSTSSGKRSNEYWDTKDMLIQYQACRRDAITYVTSLIASECVKLPAAAKREEFFAELVERYTNEFFVAVGDTETLTSIRTESEVEEDEEEEYEED